MPAGPAWPMPNQELAQTHNTVIYQGNAGVLVNPTNWDSKSGTDYNEVRVGLQNSGNILKIHQNFTTLSESDGKRVI